MNEYKNPENMFETALAKMIRNNEKKIGKSATENNKLIVSNDEQNNIKKTQKWSFFSFLYKKNKNDTSNITTEFDDVEQNILNKNNDIENTDKFLDDKKRINVNQVDNDVVMKCLSERLLFLFYINFLIHYF